MTYEEMLQSPLLTGFRPVLGYHKYFVNQNGLVISWRRKNPIVLAVHIHHNAGYLKVTLYNRLGKAINRWVHQVVAEAWVEKPASDHKLQINHKNGIRTDCHVSNLEWVTAKENQRHSKIRIGGTKLSASDAVEIRQRRLNGESGSKIAKDFNIRPSTVYNIQAGRIWAWADQLNTTPN